MSRKLSRSALAVIALAFPIAALANITGTQTLKTGQNFSFDTGAVVATGGDITLNGTSIAVVNAATDVDLASTPVASLFSGPTGYSTLVQEGTTLISTLSASFAMYLSTTPITPSVNDILVVLTNGGNYSAVLVTAIGSGSITFEYTTFISSSGGGTTPTGPQITGIVNNYDYIPNGFPNSGVAPSSIILVFGSGMAQSVANLTLNSSGGSGIPTTSAGATFTVTDSGGNTYNPGIYYAAPGQAALVLPAKVKTGTASITVSYNGQTSNSFQFQVVPSAPGLDTYYGTGSGLITAVNSKTGALYNYTNSVNPGDTILLYGTGLGADPSDSDTKFTSSPHAINANTQVYFGDVKGTVLYAGSSGYPGLDQIDVTVPSGVSGCYVTLVLTTGSGSNLIASNFGNLAVNQGGGVCTDTIFGTTISGNQINTLTGQSTVRSGGVLVGQTIMPATAPATGTVTTDVAYASFEQYTGSSYASSSGSSISIGSCSVTEVVQISGSIPKIVGLDAGTISLMGPNGNYTLTELEKGIYEAGSLTSPGLPAGAIPPTGGAFTFTGSGGADVGKFNATLNLPNPLLEWTNQSAGATVTRADGVLVTWTGGTPGSLVIIEGNSSNDTTGANGSYICFANQSALQFQVPAFVTSTLPAGTGTMTVEDAASYVTFTATGLDFGTGFGFNSVMVDTTYQ